MFEKSIMLDDLISSDEDDEFEDSARRIETLFGQEARKKGIQLSFKEDLYHPYLYADPVKLTKLTMNLVSNAIKYTPPGGRVSVNVRQLPGEDDKHCIIESVYTDTGVGMSEEFQKHMFESFTRERTSTNSGVQGTGLGLSIVKGMVEIMQGTIEVKSEVNVGTTFTVRTPHLLCDESDVAAKRSDFELTQHSGKRILLAEDNDLNAEIAMELLAERGLEVERAADGAECVEMLKIADDDYYDLVLMDVQMPRMNGYDATHIIRRLPNTSKSLIPIVAMTANAFEEDRRNALEAGMNAHIAKPIDIDVFFRTIDDFLE